MMDSKNPHTVAGAGAVCDNLAAITTASSSATAVTPDAALKHLYEMQGALFTIRALADGIAWASGCMSSDNKEVLRAIGNVDAFVDMIAATVRDMLPVSEEIETALRAMRGGRAHA